MCTQVSQCDYGDRVTIVDLRTLITFRDNVCPKGILRFSFGKQAYGKQEKKSVSVFPAHYRENIKVTDLLIRFNC